MIVYKILSNVWQEMSMINDKLFRHGGQFSKWMTQEQLGFSEAEGNKYQPSSGIIKHVFKKLHVSEEDKIIDIGCGRGRAMYMMSAFPFSRVDGYDLSDEMVSVANKNFMKAGVDDRCRAFKADASSFEDYSDYNYFYAFNPVPEKIFEMLMDKIEADIANNPRKCTFIYLNPVYDEYIRKHTQFKLCLKKRGLVRWNDVYVYTNE